MKLRATRKPASFHFLMACASIGIGSLLIAVAVAALTPIRVRITVGANLSHSRPGPIRRGADRRSENSPHSRRPVVAALPMPGAIVVRAGAWRPPVLRRRDAVAESVSADTRDGRYESRNRWQVGRDRIWLRVLY